MADAGVRTSEETAARTQEKYEVKGVESFLPGVSSEDIFALAAGAATYSGHPLGRGIVQSYMRKGLEPPIPETFRKVPGQGIISQVNGIVVYAGKKDWLTEEGFLMPECDSEKCSNHEAGTASDAAEKYQAEGYSLIWIAFNGTISGRIALADRGTFLA